MTLRTDLAAIHPPFGLQLRAGDLTLRPFAEEDLPEYADLLRRPIFEDLSADHVFPWYQTDPDTRVREALRFQWRLRAQLSREEWTLPMGIWAGGRLIGGQDVAARAFAERRTVTSGSWLTLDAQGQGYGKLMRQAVLVLAFDHLGAERAESSAVVGNERSFRVSYGCGYVDNGTMVSDDGGRRQLQQRFLVTPESFRRPQAQVQVEGVTPALLELLGADEVGTPST